MKSYLSSRYSLYMGAHIPLGPGFVLGHGFSTIVDAERIGANVKIMQQVTIGRSVGGSRAGVPTIGNNVFVVALKKPARRIIHVNPDQMLTLGAQQVLASDYDAWLVKDAYMQRFMHDGAGLRTFLYHEAVDLKLCPKPDGPKAAAEQRLNVDVMTYGTIYPYRARILTEVARAGFNLKLYGTAPLRFFDGGLRKAYTGEYIVGQRRAEVIYGARIALNTLHYAEVEAVNARFFQINGSGGFQLCDYRPALKELLPVDPELVSYRNTGECVEKIRHYLAHPQERYNLAEKIHRHALTHYGFDRLAEHILDIVGKL